MSPRRPSVKTWKIESFGITSTSLMSCNDDSATSTHAATPKTNEKPMKSRPIVL